MVCQECGTKNHEDARFCSSCGTRIVAIPPQASTLQTRPFDSPPAAAPPAPLLDPPPAQSKKRRLVKTCLLVSGTLFALVMGCAGIAAISSDDHPRAVEANSMAVVVEDESAEEKALAGEEASVAEEADQPIPEQQAAFIQTVESFYQPYHEASNELQGSAQRTKRNEALAALLPDRAVQDWTGTLESLDTTSQGNAYITIRPDGTESIIIATWNNALADVGTNSIIPTGSDLYNQLAGMSVGDRVVFSGTLAAGDEDHIVEGSLTESGSMTTPVFVMVFSDVTRLE